MATKCSFRRVTFKVRRCKEGWLPVVLIGEEPIIYPIQPDKASAKDVARARAAVLKTAGQQH